MLFPLTHAWTRAQRRSIIATTLLSLLVGAALIYGYERYYRGPSESAFYGTWEATWNEDLTVYYEFRSDHTFLVFGSPALDEESFLVKGRWYAGGPNMYLRYLDEHWAGRRPEVWHFVDIQPDVFRIRFFPNGGIYLCKRVHRAATPASNQTMEQTTDRFASAF